MTDAYQTGAADQLAKIDATLQLILAALGPLQKLPVKAKPATTERQRTYMRDYQRRKRAEAKLKANGGATEVHEPGLTA